MSWMFSIFGGAALFLAAIGIYEVLSYRLRSAPRSSAYASPLAPRGEASWHLSWGRRLRLRPLALPSARPAPSRSPG